MSYESDPNVIDWNAVAETTEPDRCIPTFYTRAVQDNLETEKQGRPIFREQEYVQVLIPGDRNVVPDRKVTPADKARWPAQYRAFTEGKEFAEGGTPLEQWPLLTTINVAELKALNFRTVEQIAEMDDSTTERLKGWGMTLRQRAKDYLKPQTDVETDLRSENQALKSNLEQQNSVLENLKKRLDEMEQEAETEPKRRGRPPKVDA